MASDIAGLQGRDLMRRLHNLVDLIELMTSVPGGGSRGLVLGADNDLPQRGSEGTLQCYVETRRLPDGSGGARWRRADMDFDVGVSGHVGACRIRASERRTLARGSRQRRGGEGEQAAPVEIAPSRAVDDLGLLQECLLATLVPNARFFSVLLAVSGALNKLAPPDACLEIRCAPEGGLLLVNRAVADPPTVRMHLDDSDGLCLSVVDGEQLARGIQFAPIDTPCEEEGRHYFDDPWSPGRVGRDGEGERLQPDLPPLMHVTLSCVLSNAGQPPIAALVAAPAVAAAAAKGAPPPPRGRAG